MIKKYIKKAIETKMSKIQDEFMKYGAAIVDNSNGKIIYTQDITKCPVCGGYADNGFSRDLPPVPYMCKACEKEEQDWAEFKEEYQKLLDSGKRICVNCLDKRFKKYKGRDTKAFDTWMLGNTMVLDKCDECGSEENGILPYGDYYKAIKASHNKTMRYYEWD